MHLRHAVAVAATSLLLSLPSQAAEPKPGSFYAGLSLGQARQSARAPGDTNDLLMGWALGYNIDKTLAVELFSHAYLFGSWGGWFNNLAGRPEASELADDHAGVAVVGALPLSDSWRLRGRLGVGRTKVAVYAAQSGNFQGGAHRTDPSVGVGLAFDPSTSWTLSLDAARLTKTKVDTAWFGVQYRF